MGRIISYDSALPVITYVSTASSITNATGYTFSMAFGAAAATRLMVACIGSNTNSTTTSTVTIGGIAASLVAVSALNGGVFCEIWAASVPTGTTGNVVTTNANIAANIVIDLFQITDLISATATATSTDTVSPVSTSVSVSAYGVVIASVAVNDGAGTGAIAWSGGVTQQTNTLADEGSGNGTRLTTAIYVASAATTVSPVLTVASAVGSAGATAAFR